MIRMEKDLDIVAMRRWSKAMFEKSHRLTVALEMLAVSESDPDRLYAQHIAENLGLNDTEVREHFTDFRDIGLLERTRRSAPHPKPKRGTRGRLGRPPKVFRRTDDEFWHCLQELGERFRRIPRDGGSQAD